ncbi:hypothetical protein BC830DRAFT_167332 [Chytriomyces sp. MP71]|nr:hypothetical protein BC830DRAFT_167332 [Chytriomyces sp. MP71]
MSQRHQFQSLRAQAPLPAGWRAEYSSQHNLFYFVSPDGSKTWTDPREGANFEPEVAVTTTASHDFQITRSGTNNTARHLLGDKPGSPPHVSPLLHGSRISQARTETYRNRRRQPLPINRRHCFCFHTRSSCCKFWIVFTVFLLACLGVAAYFLWPRSPNVTISEPYLLPNVSPIEIAGSSPSHASTASPSTLVLNMAVDVTVYSPNYEDIYVNTIHFMGHLVSPNTGIDIADAPINGLASNVNFRGKHTTTFTMPFAVTHEISTATVFSALVGSDEAINAVVNQCSATGSKLPISYTIQLTIAAISWTGFRPSTSGKAQIPCPATAKSLAGLLS